MDNTELITKAIKFIQKNPKEILSLQEIADKAGFSLTYFDSLFLRHTGYSAVEYARVYKLTRAALDLRITEKSVLDIALDYGYSNPENFTRAFKNFYGITPSEYRRKYNGSAVSWHELSGKISINRFKNTFPELKQINLDTALDYMFTHNPSMYAENIVNMMVAQASAFTLGDEFQPEHFVYASDYNSAFPLVDLVCGNEDAAIEYIKLFSRIVEWGFTIHMNPEWEWDIFNNQVANLGFTCRYGYDMIYPGKEISVPSYNGMTVRELSAGDMPLVREFKEKGGCAECHVRGLQTHFDCIANPCERGFGLFIKSEMVCLATPVLDTVRDMKKYDIGAIFAIGRGNEKNAIELIWKYVVNTSLIDGCLIGNANAHEDDTPLSVAESERMGFVKVAKNCSYRK